MRGCGIEMKDAAGAVKENEMREHVASPVGARNVKSDSIPRQGEKRENRGQLRVNFKVNDSINAAKNQTAQNLRRACQQGKRSGPIVHHFDPIENAHQLRE